MALKSEAEIRRNLESQISNNFESIFTFLSPVSAKDMDSLLGNATLEFNPDTSFRVRGIPEGNYEIAVYHEFEKTLKKGLGKVDKYIWVSMKCLVEVGKRGKVDIQVKELAKRVF